MRGLIYAAAVLALSIGAANAQGLNKTDGKANGNTPGTTGALGNVNANGVATDPGGVKAQQGRSVKAAPGTVGAAPGTTPPANQGKASQGK
jgi:hypothetical protein